jgi:hypothetical protein
MCLMDPKMVGACKDALGVVDKREICDTAIATAGSPKDGYGFCNSLHNDKHDILNPLCTRYLKELLGTLYMMLPQAKKNIKYVPRWIERSSNLSVPTTCAYEFFGDFRGDTLFAFFLFPALGIALLLESRTALQFYASVVEHMNSAVVSVGQTHMHYVSENGSVLAWSEGKVASGGVRGGAGGGA